MTRPGDGRGKKIRVSFHKNRGVRARQNDLTRSAQDDVDAAEDAHQSERVSGKGSLSRRRTLIAEDAADSPDSSQLRSAPSGALSGRVLSVVGAQGCVVMLEDGRQWTCALRRVLRTLSRESKNVLAAGDRVLVTPASHGSGVIERIEPRTATIVRGAGRFSRIIAANVDLAVIVASAADPPLKLGVVDRLLASAERGGVRPVICVNKSDLVEPRLLQPIAGQYARIGYDVVLASAVQGWGLDRLRRMLAGKASVFTGQSGVGKSSLLNALEPGLGLRTGEVSVESRKGTHTTRVAELSPLSTGGWVVDTPGMRQLALWDVRVEELEGLFREFRPYVPGCRFPDCTHTHEDSCCVKAAAAAGDISPLRYESYVRMRQGDEF